MENSDVESGINHETGANRNASPTTPLRCDTPAPPEFGVSVDKFKSLGKYEETVVTEVNENENTAQEPAPVTTTQPVAAVVEKPAPPKMMRYYPGDVVVRKEKVVTNFRQWQPSFGTVLKPAVGSEMASSVDRGSSTEFHVHWDASNRILLSKASEVGLVDRVLLRGQRVQNFEGKVGTIVDYEVTSAIQINGTNEVIDNVPLKRLSPISPYVRGLEILYRDWVGVIVSIKRNVWFRLDTGVTFFVETLEADGFSKTDPFWGMGVACPGMRTRLPIPALRRAKWINNPWKFFSKWIPFVHHLYAYLYSTVIRTEVTQLEIKWLQQTPATLAQTGYLSAPPPSLLASTDFKDVQVIGTPSFETIGINSVRKIKLTPNEEAVELEAWQESFKRKFIDGKPPNRIPTRKPYLTSDALTLMMGNGDPEIPVKILQRHNLVTVKWEDGLLEKVSAIDLPQISPTADDGEFPMGLAVARIQSDISKEDAYGIVMESNELARARTRKVNINWITDGKDEGISEASVFDIRPHPKYSMYHRGTIVFPRKTSLTTFSSAVVTDVNLNNGKMVVIRSNDHEQEEVYPHQVIALGKRCNWSFFTRTWIIDDLIVPPYQLEMEYDPNKKVVKDASELKLNVFSSLDVNNPSDSQSCPTLWDEPSFELVGFAPESHRYYKSAIGDKFGKEFAQNVKKEIEYFKNPGSVPEGIWIRCYENRLDLVSVLMVGPTKTPYDDGIFLFDLRLPSDFPASRPEVHYVSYTLEIHPLLSFDGNVCVSSISWEFIDTPETPAPPSYLGYFLSKLQTMVFTPNPYFAHPPKQNEEGTDRGHIKSRMYNQGVVVRVIDAAWNMLQKPHEPWSRSICHHFASAMPEKFFHMEKWISGDLTSESSNEDDIPCYPLLPIPDGLKIALHSRMEMFKQLFRDMASVVELSALSDTTADSESYAVQEKQQANPETRMLTPIAEITEPSSTSTFGQKLSSVSVPCDAADYTQSLDSMKNVKRSVLKKKFYPAESESENENEELELQNANEMSLSANE